jgi:hypothetical protein
MKNSSIAIYKLGLAFAQVASVSSILAFKFLTLLSLLKHCFDVHIVETLTTSNSSFLDSMNSFTISILFALKAFVLLE